MRFDLSKRQMRFIRITAIILACLLAFRVADFALSELTDKKAYSDAERTDSEQWLALYERVLSSEALSDEDYNTVFTQTGLGRPAVDALRERGEAYKIADYYEYYTLDKSFECVREGVFACHDRIISQDGEPLRNPPFADLRDGDIIITLSIHSLGWRHGHSAVVTDAENGLTVEAVMMGYDSSYSTVYSWDTYPLAAVLRAKDADEQTGREIADFVSHNMVGLDYWLLAGIIGGRDTEKTPRGTHCSHLAWYAYMKQGIDIDSDGGLIVTPYDILHSDELEIVQIYGNINEL